ncbi:MAG TPA: tetratricopeptide repeat protein, partial [Gaiellaceae bacterium]|nr:tetratricopeptide repeat protein [Gaiellaceae bacterium]
MVVVYAPVLWCGFVNFDDPEYVTDNGWVQGGLTWAGVGWAFRTFWAANWHPLTWVSHMLDVTLFGMAVGGHHATNVLLHAGAALLLFLALSRMTGAPWRSAVVAAVFALHPLRVESVVWISERKDVLSAFFWMAALYEYARYVERPGAWRYVVLLGVVVAGLLAKPMVVTLPFALLLLDVWPLGRLRLEWAARRTWMPLVLEKVPLLVLALATSAVVYMAQSAGGAVTPLTVQRFPLRVANALLSYVTYLGMTLWPSGLAIFYPYREIYPPWQVAGAALLIGGVTAGALRWARRAPYVLVGWLWYLGTLVPVIGIVRAGDQSMADRFTYIPHVGLFVAVVWGVAELTAGWRARDRVLPAAVATVLAACVVVTELQLPHWRDSFALFGHALAVTERSALAHTNYGYALLERKRPTEALDHFRQAVELRPEYPKARLNLGLGLATVGRSEEAMVEYREAIRLSPDYPAPRYDLALELAEHGRLDEAIAEYRETLRIEPSHTKARNGLGLALANQGRLDEAIVEYEAALALDPRLAATHNNLAVALERLGRADEALAHYREAARLAPDDARAHFNLGAVLAGRERFGEAEAEYRLTLRLRPDLVETHLGLGDALLAQDRASEAVAEYRRALAVRPGWAAAETRIAWAIATRGGGDGDATEAVRLAEHARDQTEGGD